MSTQVYQLSGGGIAALANKPILSPRNPVATDLVDPNGSPYELGQYWRNTATNTVYFFIGASAVSPWIEVVESGGGPITTLTGDSGGAVAPVAGNIDLLGTANEISTTGTAGTITFSLPTTLIAPGTFEATTSVTSPVYTAPAATDMDIIAAAGQDIDIQMGDAAGANNVSFFSSTPTLVTTLTSLGFLTTSGDIVATRSAAAVDVTVEATNSDNTSGTSNAFFEAAVGGASSGDAGIRFQVSGVATNWSAGLDNSDSDAWVLSASNTIGTSNALRFDHTSLDAQFGGDVDLPAGNLTVSGSITADSFIETITDITLTQSPLLQSNVNTGAAPTGATGDVNLMILQEGEIMEQFILGAGQTIIAPRMTTAGLLTSLDLTVAEGAEYNWGMRANASPTFVIGTSPAFFFELEVTAADIGGLDPLLAGFRIVQANDATLANYTDFAAIGANATTAADVVVIQTQLNTGGIVVTNTTDAWTDGQTRIFRINVSAAGVVTYLINGVAPTVTAAFTFDNGDRVAPFIRHLFGAATPGAINWVNFSYGLQ